MNAADEWRCSPYPDRLLELLGGRLTLRGARLFTIGYCRLRPERVTSRFAIRLLDRLENIAEGNEPESRLDEVTSQLVSGGRSCALARQAVIRNWSAPHRDLAWTLKVPLQLIDRQVALDHASRRAGPSPANAHPTHPWHQAFQPAFVDFVKPKADLLRCLFPNPFGSIDFSPSWRTDTVLSLARVMYETRDFSAMPILADALQDAGCDSDDVLSHCRDAARVHVRGCWVTDLVLGKS